MKAFLDQQDFKVMDWPGNSLDLNPIENYWNPMKNKLKKGCGNLPAQAAGRSVEGPQQ
jgi:hypothetical protein